MNEPVSHYVPGAPPDPAPERAPAAATPSVGSGERLGARLMAERKAQGLSLGDVARQLKLAVRQVEALERDDHAALPGMVFVRGFLRNYAKLLQLDPEPLLAMIAAQAPAAPEPVAPAAASDPGVGKASWPGFGWIAAGLVLAVLVTAAIFEGRQREAPAQSAARPLPAPSAEGLQRPDSPPSNVGTSAAPVGPVAATEGASTAALPDAPAAVTAADEAQLKLAFEASSWVEVKDKAGNVIFSQLNGAGTEQLVTGQPPLTVVIGNAHAVRVTYRDRAVDLAPHTKVDVARVVLE